MYASRRISRIAQAAQLVETASVTTSPHQFTIKLPFLALVLAGKHASSSPPRRRESACTLSGWFCSSRGYQNKEARQSDRGKIPARYAPYRSPPLASISHMHCACKFASSQKKGAFHCPHSGRRPRVWLGGRSRETGGHAADPTWMQPWRSAAQRLRIKIKRLVDGARTPAGRQ